MILNIQELFSLKTYLLVILIIVLRGSTNGQVTVEPVLVDSITLPLATSSSAA
jgi:hypothetical protein